MILVSNNITCYCGHAILTHRAKIWDKNNEMSGEERFVRILIIYKTLLRLKDPLCYVFR